MLAALLNDMSEIFQGKVGKQDGIETSFEFKKDAKPFYARPHPVPVFFQAVTKNTIKRMCDHKILHDTREDTKWTAPTFAVLKKTKEV